MKFADRRFSGAGKKQGGDGTITALPLADERMKLPNNLMKGLEQVRGKLMENTYFMGAAYGALENKKGLKALLESEIGRLKKEKNIARATVEDALAWSFKKTEEAGALEKLESAVKNIGASALEYVELENKLFEKHGDYFVCDIANGDEVLAEKLSRIIGELEFRGYRWPVASLASLSDEPASAAEKLAGIAERYGANELGDPVLMIWFQTVIVNSTKETSG